MLYPLPYSGQFCSVKLSHFLPISILTLSLLLLVVSVGATTLDWGPAEFQDLFFCFLKKKRKKKLILAGLNLTSRREHMGSFSFFFSFS